MKHILYQHSIYSLLFLCSYLLSEWVTAFQSSPYHVYQTFFSRNTKTTTLFGAMNKRNKQGDLLKKMQLAKEQARQRENAELEQLGKKAKPLLSDEEMKKMNDMKRFEELLSSDSALTNYDFDGGSNYITQQQENENIDASFRGVDRLFEGDKAPTDSFQDLVSIETENAIGKGAAERLIPWLRNANSNDYLVIITDPRLKSSELRSTMKLVSKTFASDDLLSKLIFVNADTPAENRRWLKKQEIDNLKLYSDEKQEFMREYTALGEKRWAICMFIIAKGRIQKLVREVDVDIACKAIKNAVSTLEL